MTKTKDIAEFNPEVWAQEAANVQDFLFQYQGLEVVDDETFALANDIIKACKNRIKQVIEKREGYTKPIDAIKSLFMDNQKAICKPLEGTVERFEGQVKAYYFAKLQRIADEQKRLDAEALKQAQSEHKTEIVVPVLAKPAATTRGGYATTTIKDHWIGEIIDAALIPAEFCSPDPKKIKAAIDLGTRTIAGVKIWNDGTLVSR